MTLDDIVARALQRERGKRYADAREMSDALERYLRVAPCHSHALAHLLHDLFGEESAEHTPDLPDWTTADAPDRAPATRAGTPAPPIEIEIDAEEPPLDAAALLAGAAPGAAPLAPDRRPLVRGVLAALCAATLVTCFCWASWRARRPAPVAAAEQPSSSFVAGPRAVAPVASPPLIEAAPAVAAAPSPAAAPAKARAAPPSTHVRAAKKTAARRLTNDVTFDPFK